jgi:hypothetical protein
MMLFLTMLLVLVLVMMLLVLLSGWSVRRVLCQDSQQGRGQAGGHRKPLLTRKQINTQWTSTNKKFKSVIAMTQ